MEAFDDEISNECIIDLLAKAYAARMVKTIRESLRKENILDLLEKDIKDAYEMGSRKESDFDEVHKLVYKTIVGSDNLKERVEINKVARNIFHDELDEESQRYFEQSLKEWKENMSLQMQEQYRGMLERWKQRFLDERDGVISQDEIDELRTDNKSVLCDIDDICSEQTRVVGELGKSMKEYMLEKEKERSLLESGLKN